MGQQIHHQHQYRGCQVAIWCAVERNPAFNAPKIGFWIRTGIHSIQFLGAWAVFYGTLLRDMLVATYTPTVVAWIALIGATAAWAWPEPRSETAGTAFWWIVSAQLLTGLAGWLPAMRRWRPLKARYLAEHPEEAEA